jgi:YbbR domain-containing protein
MLVQYNLPAKIIAIVVAVILWLFVMNDQNPSISGSFTVPVTVMNAPDGYKISYAEDKVKIKVRGPRSLFVNADTDEFKAYIDLDGVSDGKQAVKVQTILPQGLELVSTSSDTIDVMLDRIVQHRMPVDLIVTGAPVPGSTVAKVVKSVQYVTIEGPESAIANVARVIGYVGVSGNATDFSLEVPLSAVNSDGKAVDGVRVIPSSVKASVQLARGLTKKIVTIKPIFSGDLPDGFLVGNVRVDPSKIEIAGEASLIEGIDTINTENISLAKMKKNTKKVVKLDLPEGITVTNRDVSVSVEISEKKKNED